MEKAEVLHKRVAQEAGVVLGCTKSPESSQKSLALSTNGTDDFHKFHININTCKHYGWAQSARILHLVKIRSK